MAFKPSRIMPKSKTWLRKYKPERPVTLPTDSESRGIAIKRRLDDFLEARQLAENLYDVMEVEYDD